MSENGRDGKRVSVDSGGRGKDAGYRGSVLFDGWPLFADPYLDDIRSDPRFVAMLDELDGYLAVMRDRLEKAEGSADYAGLRAMAART